jgi:two-component system cell cycle response regulator
MSARILIIEDNATNVELMVYLFRAFGYDPVTAGDGEAGLEAVHREPFDLVICDVQMPGVDGYELARRLKGHPTFRSIPLVAVTAMAMVGDRDRALAAGFDGYIAKPINPETFIKQVESFVRLRPEEQARRPKPAPPAPPKASTLAQSAPPRTRILLVDNSPVNHDLMRSIVEPFGYEIVSAKSVADGLERARQAPPDIILSDLHWPEASGYDLLQAVRKDPKLRALPFIFISSTSWPEREVADGLSRGADAFLSRPVDPQEVLHRIEESLKKART